jgi:ABC-type phosphate transport system substrate-binding protein
MKKTIFIAAAMVLIYALSLQAGTVIVIANKGVASSSVSRDEIQRMFLGKKTTWENGKKVVPVDQKGGRVQSGFLAEILKKTEAQYDSYWKQAVFTGVGLPPKSFETDAEVVQFVEKTDGAVGYIDSDSPHAAVKKLDIK